MDKFYKEKRFKYKGIFDCYYGLSEYGYRAAYVNINIKDFKNSDGSYLSKSDIEYMICNGVDNDHSITYICTDEINENIVTFGCDFGHINNLYDIEAFKQYFPELLDSDQINKMENRNNNKRKYNCNTFVGTKEMCEMACIDICECIRKYYDPED